MPATEEITHLVGPDGSFSDGYLESMIDDPETGEKTNLFPDEVRQNTDVKNSKNLVGVLKTLVNQGKLIGKNKIGIPSADASDEEWMATMKALGMPDKPDGYGLSLESIPEGQQDTQLFEAFTNWAHKHRLLPKQAQGLFAEWNAFMADREKKFQDDFDLQLETGMRQMKDKLGAQYDAEMDGAERLINAMCSGLKRYGFDETVADDMANRLYNDIRKDPRIGALFMYGGSLISEDRLTNIPRGKHAAVTPAEAKEQIEAMKAETKHPYWNENDPGHKQAREKYDMLYKIAYPS